MRLFIMRWNLDEIRRLKIKQKFYIMLTRELTQSQNYVKKQKIVIEQLQELLNSMKQWEQMQFINASVVSESITWNKYLMNYSTPKKYRILLTTGL